MAWRCTGMRFTVIDRSMNGIVFNFHDVALLLVAGECGMLAILFLAYRGNSSPAHTLLAIFFLLNMLITIDTLIYWGQAFRYWVFHISPDLFFIFGFAYFLQGPLLYLYVRSAICQESSFHRLHVLHALPAIFAQLYLYFVYHRYPVGIQGDLVLNGDIYSSTGGFHTVFVTVKKTMVVAYGIACCLPVFRKIKGLKSQQIKRESSMLTWSFLLAGGFLVVWCWNLMTHIFGIYHPGGVSEVMGMTGNYLSMLLITTLVFYGLLCTDVLVGNKPDKNSDQQVSCEPIDPRLVERVSTAMESDKLFLNPRLTVEEFAAHVHMPPRQVSLVIKHQFGCNFLEYVNRYRVETAKIGLADPSNRGESVLDIASKSGFNSKATFNRFFKRFSGFTPTEYRRRCLTVPLD